MYAAYGGYHDLVDLLIKHGGNHLTKNTESQTLLHVCLIGLGVNGYVDTVKLLLRLDPPINVLHMDENKMTARSYAVDLHRDDKILDLLKAAGDKVDAGKVYEMTDENSVTSEQLLFNNR